MTDFYLTLERFYSDRVNTLGRLFIDGAYECLMLEDAHQIVKIAGKTRIPSGRYEIIKRTYGRIFTAYNKRWSHECVFEISGVPGFTDILLHGGVHHEHTEGCPLTGKMIEGAADKFYLRQSRIAYVGIYDKIIIPMNDNRRVFIDIIDRDMAIAI